MVLTVRLDITLGDSLTLLTCMHVPHGCACCAGAVAGPGPGSTTTGGELLWKMLWTVLLTCVFAHYITVAHFRSHRLSGCSLTCNF